MFLSFRVAVYEITLEAGGQGLHLPQYKGSTLRGGFGHVFRRICCSQREAKCLTCMLSPSCPYAQIFEPAPPPGSMVLKHYTDIPRPFVIEPPLDTKTYYQPGDAVIFRLILIGQAIGYLPYFILAFRELGNVGIGKGRLPFTLADVSAVDVITGNQTSVYNGKSNTVIPVKNEVTMAQLADAEGSIGGRMRLEFITMTRLKYAHTLVTDIPFHVLIRNLLRRISTLYYFFHGQTEEQVDYKGLIAAAEQVRTVSSQLIMENWERYSQRKDARMNMGGMVGEVVYEGEFEPFMALLRLGEIIHVGKGCVFGLGKYRFALPPRSVTTYNSD